MSQHDYEMLASLARDKARFAMHQGNPTRARTWIEAAEAAERAAWTSVTNPNPAPNPNALQRIADALNHLARIADREPA